MEVSFVETMRGALQGPDGVPHPVEFDAVAAAPSLRGLWRTGETALRGLVRAPHWADEVSARGTLTLSPRLLAYRLDFLGRDGRALVLEGQKHPSLASLKESMTVMEAVLRDASGAALASGRLSFDLRELLPFVASWLPVGRRAQRALDARRRAVERAVLDAEGR